MEAPLTRRRFTIAALALALPFALLVALPSLAYDTGDAVAGFSGTDASGGKQSLSSYRGKIVVLVVWGSQCRSSSQFASQLAALKRSYPGVKWLGIAPNAGESARVILKKKRAQGLSFPIIVDTGGKIAKALGAQMTPSVFVLNAQGKMAYQGAISDRAKKPKQRHLDAALRALTGGKAPRTTKTRVKGFRIKY